MFRKMTVILAAMTLLALAACNSSMTSPVTGHSDDLQGWVGDGGKDQDTTQKACIEEERRVELTSPGQNASIQVGKQYFVTWDAIELCGEFTVDVEASYDGGRSFEPIALGLVDALSARWNVPLKHAGKTPLIQITAEDHMGVLISRVQLNNKLVRANTRPDGRTPQERD
ncbi:MAG: hypothetical protein ACE5G2_06895 [Candidatus Krumholzibacteriia bacterium]